MAQMPLLNLKSKQNKKAIQAPKALCRQSAQCYTSVVLRSPVPVFLTEIIQKSEVLFWIDQCVLARWNTDFMKYLAMEGVTLGTSS